MTDFALELRACREMALLSQSRLARLAGFDHSYVSRLENATRMPTRDAVLAFAAALELPPAERDRLLASAGYAPVDSAGLLADEPELADLLALLRGERDAGVADAVRRHVRAIVDGLRAAEGVAA